jgi:hypothetical protein
VSARTGEGVAELVRVIQACPLRRAPAVADERQLLRIAQEELATRFTAAAGDERVRRLTEDWREGRLGVTEAAAELLRLLGAE